MKKLRKKEFAVHWKGDGRQIILISVAVFVVTALLCMSMQVKSGYMLCCSMLSFIFAPLLCKNHRISKYEKERFEDLNAYLSQMAQSFTSTKRIMMSLVETKNTFALGRMHQLLTKAIWHIENSSDTGLAEQEALSILEEAYDCERIRTLHDFLIKAQSRGGACEGEFRLLEQLRQAWEKAVMDYRNTVRLARDLVAAEYLVLLLVCAFMLRQFPADLSVSGFPAIQILNMFGILCFWLLLERMDRKLTRSLLWDGAVMSKEEAERGFAFLENFSPSKERLKSLPAASGMLVLLMILAASGRNAGLAVAGLLMAAGLLNRHYIRSLLIKRKLRAEMRRAFPKWLFDVLLLIQSENVPVAIFLSAQKAAPVFTRELLKMSEHLEENPEDAGAFMGFLADYQITGVKAAMRKLYSLSVGAGGRGEVMRVIVDSNMSLLAEAERKKLDRKGQMFSACYMLPTVPVMVCMAGYGIALMAVIFRNVMSAI